MKILPSQHLNSWGVNFNFSIKTSQPICCISCIYSPSCHYSPLPPLISSDLLHHTITHHTSHIIYRNIQSLAIKHPTTHKPQNREKKKEEETTKPSPKARFSSTWHCGREKKRDRNGCAVVFLALGQLWSLQGKYLRLLQFKTTSSFLCDVLLSHDCFVCCSICYMGH